MSGKSAFQFAISQPGGQTRQDQRGRKVGFPAALDVMFYAVADRKAPRVI